MENFQCYLILNPYYYLMLYIFYFINALDFSNMDYQLKNKEYIARKQCSNIIINAVNLEKFIIFKNKGMNMELKKNPCAVYGMDFNSEGNKFVVVGKDFHVRIYDSETKEVDIDFPQ